MDERDQSVESNVVHLAMDRFSSSGGSFYLTGAKEFQSRRGRLPAGRGRARMMGPCGMGRP